MRISTQKMLTVILVILSFPFFTAGILNGKDALVLEKEADLEAFLAPAVLAELPENYPYEAVKAQAILVRSRCYAKLDQGECLESVIGDLVQEGKKSHGTYKISAEADILCEEAVRETRGKVLKYGGKVVEGPFFRAGNGTTRSGTDVFQNEEYPWLVNIESPWDIDSEEYLHAVSFSPEQLIQTIEKKEKELPEKIFGPDDWKNVMDGTWTAEQMAEIFQISGLDTAGYVTEVTAGKLKMAGESFRNILDLPSACFSVQAIDGKIRFLCKGLGHGVGLSQTGAAAMAKEGKSASEILSYYFPQVVVSENT